jgi:hypothetical protein
VKTAQRIILAAGFVTLGVLLWKMDAAAIAGLVVKVGWGFAFILVQEIGAHVLNALGWRYAMRPAAAAAYPLKDLLRFRIIGDGVNYLTPSAQIAGEFARASLLGPQRSFDERLAGVVAAKFSQGIAQFLFALFGAAWLVGARVPALAPYQGWLQTAAILSILALFAFMAYEKLTPGRATADPESLPGGLRGLPRQMKSFVQDFPGRSALSVVFFLLGFAWNAIEVYWICRFLDIPVSWGTALAIETMSSIIDGILFMVPAKVGTQEAGKTAIFAMLGMSARAGFALGIVRHIRELAWAGLGLALYSSQVKANKESAPAREEPAEASPEPVA